MSLVALVAAQLARTERAVGLRTQLIVGLAAHYEYRNHEHRIEFVRSQ
jgi:hypothetical protein